MSIEKSKDLFWQRAGNIKLRILFSNIFACKLAWRKVNIFFINLWKYFLISSNGFRLKEISVYLQHTVGVRGHALLWSGLCVRYGKVYNKCTMAHIFLIANPKFQLQILSSFGDITKSVKWNGIPENHFLCIFIIASSPGVHTFFCLWRVNKKLPQGETSQNALQRSRSIN